jgi:hypothetical protein
LPQHLCRNVTHQRELNTLWQQLNRFGGEISGEKKIATKKERKQKQRWKYRELRRSTG